mgnify:FL=1
MVAATAKARKAKTGTITEGKTISNEPRSFLLSPGEPGPPFKSTERSAE